MVARKVAGKKAPEKLKLKKETLKDLEPRGRVKGGLATAVAACMERPGGGDGGTGTTAVQAPLVPHRPTH